MCFTISLDLNRWILLNARDLIFQTINKSTVRRLNIKIPRFQHFWVSLLIFFFLLLESSFRSGRSLSLSLAYTWKRKRNTNPGNHSIFDLYQNFIEVFISLLFFLLFRGRFRVSVASDSQFSSDFSPLLVFVKKIYQNLIQWFIAHKLVYQNVAAVFEFAQFFIAQIAATCLNFKSCHFSICS